jgi:hypothetical protein
MTGLSFRSSSTESSASFGVVRALELSDPLLSIWSRAHGADPYGTRFPERMSGVLQSAPLKSEEAPTVLASA